MLIFICILSSICFCIVDSAELVVVHVMKETERRLRELALEGLSIGMYSDRTMVFVLFALVIHSLLFRQYDTLDLSEKIE